MRTTFRIAFVLILSLALPSASQAQGIYSVDYSSLDELRAVVSRGATVRHVGLDSALMSGDALLFRDLRAEGTIVEAVDGAGRTDKLFLCYPRGSFAAFDDLCDVLWYEPDGAALVAADASGLEALRSVSFSVHELPDHVNVDEWFNQTPPPPVAELPARDAPRVRGMVGDVLGAVSADSLMNHVLRLSEDGEGGLRMRFAYSDELLSEAKPYIVSRLEAYLPPSATIRTQAFTRAGYSCEGDHSETVDYPLENIVATLPGTGRLDGYYVVCGHYDATAVNSYDPLDFFWWCDGLTAGADDNATGVATVLEAARVLSGMSFPFDIRFVLFTCEELGLIGSEHYAAAAEDSGDTVYGVLNVDMVAYKRAESNPDTCHLVTNPGSGWLADWVKQTSSEYDSHFPDLDVERIDKALAYSDHASFWAHGYDGVVAIEHWNPRYRNPYYHTLEDTIATVSESQLLSVAKLIAGSMARMADPEGTINLAVFDGDVSFTPVQLWTGTPTSVKVDVHVFGPDESVDMTLEVWDGEPDDGELLSAYSVDRAMGGGEVITHEFVWDLVEGDLGNHTIHARVLTDGTEELALSDNEVAVDVIVSVPGEVYVDSHHVAPNPVRSGDELVFQYELSREAGGIDLDVYDITGQRITGMSARNTGPPGTAPLPGTAAGDNTLSWGEMERGAALPSSGVYLYRLAVYERGSEDPAEEQTGKFAVVR